jgi:hypothetical protein
MLVSVLDLVKKPKIVAKSVAKNAPLTPNLTESTGYRRRRLVRAENEKTPENRGFSL